MLATLPFHVFIFIFALKWREVLTNLNTSYLSRPSWPALRRLGDGKCLILASNYTFSALPHQNNCLAGHIHFTVQFLWSFVFQGFKKRKRKERNKTNLFPNYKNTLCWYTYTHPYNWCIWYSTYNSKPYNAFDILLQSQTTTESLILHLTLEIKNIYMQQWYFW